MDEIKIHHHDDTVEDIGQAAPVGEPCSHCLDTRWVMLTAENDYGELEDYFVLCRKCQGR